MKIFVQFEANRVYLLTLVNIYKVPNKHSVSVIGHFLLDLWRSDGDMYAKVHRISKNEGTERRTFLNTL